MGLWSTQAKVEGIVPKAAWQWGRDSSVVNNPLGEPDHTPLYVGLRLHGALWKVTICFSLLCRRAPFFGDYGRHS